MSKERAEVGANVGEIQPEIFLKEQTNSSCGRIREKMSDVEQNQQKDRIKIAVRDIHNSSVSDVLRMAKLQLIESEMENKHRSELLYHMTRQKLEMCQLRKELGVLSGVNDTSPLSTSTRNSYGLSQKSLNCKSPHMQRYTTGTEKTGSLGDSGFDSNIDDCISNEDGKPLGIAIKVPDLPGSPELVPAKPTWGENVVKENCSSNNRSEELLSDVSHFNSLYDYGRTKNRYSRGFVSKSDEFPARAVHWRNTPSKFNASLYKTEICRSWSEFGLCPYSHDCHYAHGFAELRVKPKPHWKYKTEMCKKYLNGYCPYGSRCCFVHELNEFQKPVGPGLRPQRYADQKKAPHLRWHGEPAQKYQCDVLIQAPNVYE